MMVAAETHAMSSIEQQIVSKYPEQFRGGEFWLGIDIGDGWKSIVLDACQQVQETLSADELRIFHWTQIKQKLGGLRMYWRPRGEGGFRQSVEAAASDCTLQHEISAEITANTLSPATLSRIRSIVDLAEARASSTCEACGATGRLARRGPIRVLCGTCARNQVGVPILNRHRETKSEKNANEQATS